MIAVLVAIAAWPDPLTALTEPLTPAGFWTAERVFRLRAVCVLYAAGLVAHGLLRIGLNAAEAASGRISQARPLTEHWRSVLVLIIAAACVRARYLNAPVDYDEAYSFLHYARGSPLETLARYDSTNNHLLNSLFMWFGYRLFGPREWALRLGAFLPGVLLPGLVYLGGTAIGLRAGAWIAGWLAVWSPAAVEYSTNARGYCWVAAATALLVIQLSRCTSGRSRSQVAAGLTATTSLWALPVALPLVCGTACWLGAASPGPLRTRVQLALRWLLAVGMAGGLLYVPGLVAVGFQAARNPFVQPIDPTLWATRFPLAVAEGLGIAFVELPMDGVAAKLHGGLARMWSKWFGHGTTALAALAAFAPWFAVVANRGRQPWRLPVALLVSYVGCLALLRLAPPPRVFVPVLPLQLLLVGSVFDWIARPARPLRGFRFAVAAIALAGTALFYAGRPLPYRPVHQSWRLDVPEAVRLMLDGTQQPICVLASLPADMSTRFYLNRAGVQWHWGVDSACAETFLLWLGHEPPRPDSVRRDPVLRDHADVLDRMVTLQVARLRRSVLYRLVPAAVSVRRVLRAAPAGPADP